MWGCSGAAQGARFVGPPSPRALVLSTLIHLSVLWLLLWVPLCLAAAVESTAAFTDAACGGLVPAGWRWDPQLLQRLAAPATALPPRNAVADSQWPGHACGRAQSLQCAATGLPWTVVPAFTDDR